METVLKEVEGIDEVKQDDFANKTRFTSDKSELKERIRKFSTLAGLTVLVLYGIAFVDGYGASANILV